MDTSEFPASDPSLVPSMTRPSPFRAIALRFAICVCIALALLVSPLAAQHGHHKATTPQPTVNPLSCNPAIGCSAGNPPTIWLSPDPRGHHYDYHQSTTMTDTVHWCDDGGLTSTSRYITYNGTNLSDTYRGGTYSGCWAYATSVVTLNLVAGKDSIIASIADNFNQRTTIGGSFTYDPREESVTPKGTVARVLPDTLVTQQFQITNDRPTTQTYALAVICAARLNCQADSSKITLGPTPFNVGVAHVTYSTGTYGSIDTVRLRLASDSNAIDIDTGSVIATANAPRTTVSFTSDNNDDQQLGLCANSCFASTYAYSSVPYVSLGTPRSATLLYNSDRSSARPFVTADVTLAAGSPSPTELRLEVLRNGAHLRYVNGDTILHFQSSASVLAPGQATPVRLVGQIASDSAMATGMDPVNIMVTAVYTDHSEVAIDTTKLMIVNLSTPDLLPVAGWTVAGVQHLFFQTDSTMLIVEGDGSGVYFKCKTYTSACAGPTGDFSQLKSAGSGGSLTYTRYYPDSSRIVFNNLGQMTKQIDRWGNETDLTYDVNGHLYAIQDPLMTYNGGSSRTEIEFWYNTGSFTIAMPGPRGTAASATRGSVVAYDANKRVTTLTDPDSLTTSLGYDPRGRLARVIDRRHDTASFTYDTLSWKLTKVTLPTIAVDAGSGGSTVNAAPVLQYRPWQSTGAPTHATGSSAAAPVRIDTLMATVTNPDSITSRFSVDRWGQPLVTIDALNDTTTIQRTGIFATQVTSPLGQVDSYTYSGAHLVQSLPHNQPATDYFYDDWGMVDSVSGGGAPAQSLKYDATHHWTIARTHGLYPDTTFLDSRGRDTANVDPLQHRTRYFYDATFGTLDSTIAAAGQWSSRTLSAYGLDSISRANGRPAATAWYDQLNRVTRTYIAPGDSATRYRYDGLYQTATTDPKGQLFKNTVNAFGWATKSYDPGDTIGTYTSAQYSASGLVKHARNRRGQWIAFQYDPLGRLTSRRDPIAPADSFQYLKHGRVVIASNSIATDTIAAGTDESDTLTTVLKGSTWFRRVHTKTTGVSADTTTITTSAPAMSFATRTEYWSPSVGALDSIKVGSSKVGYSYNGELLDSAITYPGYTRYVSTTSTHDFYESYFSALAVDTLFAVRYAYDSLGRILSESRDNGYHSGVIFDVGNYAYNNDGALRWYSRGRTQNRSCSPGYGCTFAGETTYQTYGYPTYDPALNQLVQVDSTHGNAKDSAVFALGDRITSWKGATYAYDSDGNRDEKTVGSTHTNYTWSAGGELLSVSNGTTTATYDYDALGQLVRRKTNGAVDRYFLWDNGQLLAELDSSAATKINEFAYQPGVDKPLARITGGSTQFFQMDARGNVTGLTSGASIIQSVRFGPWGDIEQQVGDSLADTRLGWKGLLWEGGPSSLYYVRSRWFDTGTRSFISEDPLALGGARNTYSYADNDPINGVDATGLKTQQCYIEWAFYYNPDTGQIYDGTQFPLYWWCDGGNSNPGDPGHGGGGGADGGTSKKSQPNQQSYADCVKEDGDYFSLQHGLQSLSGGRLGNDAVSGVLLGNSVSDAIDFVQSLFSGNYSKASRVGAGEIIDETGGKVAKVLASKLPNVAVSVRASAAVGVTTTDVSATLLLSLEAEGIIPIGSLASTAAETADGALEALSRVKLPIDLTVSMFSATVCSIGR